jgi:HEAT repeat protein
MNERLDELLPACTVKLTLPGGRGWGTGFWVAPGQIVTCAHLFKGLPLETTVAVTWRGRSLLPGRVTQLWQGEDLAQVQCDLPEDMAVPCVQLGQGVQPGDELYFFGYPDQDFPQGCPVTVRCEGLTGDQPPLIKFKQRQIRSGMSGSPLLNLRTGQVCGVVKFTRDRGSDLGGGAIPASTLWAQLPELQPLQVAFHQGCDRWAQAAQRLQADAGSQVNLGGTNTQIQTGPDNTNFVEGVHHHYWSAEGRPQHEQPVTPNFEPYLRAILDDEDYREWDEVYTATTVEGRKPSPQPRFSKRLKLQVETVKVDKEAAELELKEQVEHWDVLAGLRKYAAEHVLLMGKPGSGKSTSLERLLWEEAGTALQQPDAKIPVLVKLRRCTSTVEQLIQDFFSGHGLRLAIGDIGHLLGQGKLLLLLDGLNELPDAFRTAVANFRDRYRQTTPMVVSTRDLSVGGTLDIKKTLRMLPLTEPQMREFVRGYLGTEGDKLFQQIKGDRLGKFAETPLLLWMLCRVFAQNGQVPANLGLAFREFTQLYDQQVQADAAVESREQWPKLLRHLAFALMHDKELVEFRLSMPREEAENVLTECLQQAGRSDARDCAERWLQDLLDYHLLQPVRQPNLAEHIEFRHQLIQEYYAAEYLLRLLPELKDDQLKRDYLNLLKWTEPIALMLALLDEESQALRVVRLALKVDLLFGARLSGQTKVEFQPQAVNMIRSLKIPKQWKIGPFKFRKMVEPTAWLKTKLLGKTDSECVTLDLCELSKNPDLNVRRLAVGELTQIHPKRDNLELIKILKSPDPYVRRRIAEILSEIGSKLSVNSLCDLLLNDTSSNVRDYVAKLLGKIDSEKARYALRKALSDFSGPVRRSALPALANADPQMPIDELIQALYKPDKYLCDGAILALLKIDPHTTIPAVVESIKNPYFESCEMAAELLVRIGSKAAIRSLHDLLNSTNLGENKRSTIAMTLFSKGAIFPDLISWYEPRFLNALQKRNTGIKIPPSKLNFEENILSGIIAGIAGNEWHESLSMSRKLIDSLVVFNADCLTILIPVLLDLLDSEDETTRGRAYKILRKVDIGQAILGYFYAVIHPSYLVRYRASRVLEELGSEHVFSALKEMDSGLGFEIIYALVEIFPGWLSDRDDVELIEILERTVRFIDQYVYRHKLSNKGLILSGSFISLLMGEIKSLNSNQDNSTGLIENLSKGSISVLVDEVIGSENLHVCGSAARFLGEVGSKDVIPDLFEIAVGHRGSVMYTVIDSVMYTVIDSLVKIAKREGVSVLLEFVEHPQREVRDIVTDALLKTISEVEVSFLTRLIKHTEYEDVRVFSVKALGSIFSESVNIEVAEVNEIHRILLESSRESDSRLRGSIATTLGYMNLRESIPGLIELMKDPTQNVRQKAGFALLSMAEKRTESLACYQADIFSLIFHGSEDIVINIIRAIQSESQFYSHEIWQEAVQNQKFNKRKRCYG